MNSSDHFGCSFLKFGFGFSLLGGSRRFPDACSSLRKLAGLEEVLEASCGNDVEDELALELDDNPRTTTSTTFSVLHRILSHPWSVVAFDHWPTHRYIRVLRRVCLMTGRQVHHRAFAPSRRDQDREHFLVLPRSFALLHRPLPLWGSWTFEGFSVRLSLNPFCSACALMLWNRP